MTDHRTNPMSRPATTPTPTPIPAGRAFTLIELMISIALVLVLMVGINRVFRLTSETIGTGTTLSGMARDDRAIQATTDNDFKGAMADSPVFMIYSERAYAFLSPRDRATDLDGNPGTADGNGNGVETDVGLYPSGDQFHPAIVSDRNHRLDRIGFFARGRFERQTADTNGTFTSPLTSNEAWVWYGHVRTPGDRNDNNTQFTGVAKEQFPHLGYRPSGVNHYEFYEKTPVAGNWVLGRVATLMVDETSSGSASFATTARRYTTTPPAVQYSLAPLGWKSPLSATPTTPPLSKDDYEPLDQSLSAAADLRPFRARFDVAGRSVSQFRDIVDTWALTERSQLGAERTWWWDLVYDSETEPRRTGAANTYTEVLPFRYECDPLVQKPITGTGMARAVPYLLPHCSQFIVEFAGDFIKQDATTGALLTAEPDGMIDFIVENQGNPNEIRRPRWYGFPRDVAGPNGAGPDGLIQPAIDVVPVRDIALVQQPFEREVPQGAPKANYGATGFAGLLGTDHYSCIWRSGAPRMVRLLIKIDDPLGRVKEGRWIELVYSID